MTDALFRHPLQPEPAVGDRLVLDGAEGRHATVKRIEVGEQVLLADGAGHGARCTVVGVGRDRLDLEVVDLIADPGSARTLVVAQALPKGERAETAVETLTEVGVDGVLPWQSHRTIVRWQGERGERSRQRWAAAAREAAKQSRRLRTPDIEPVVSTRQLADRVAGAARCYLLHEEATTWLSADLAADPLPPSGEVLLVVGPEGGIAPDELAELTAAGGRAVLVADHVLRTSTAGVVALATLAADLHRGDR